MYLLTKQNLEKPTRDKIMSITYNLKSASKKELTMISPFNGVDVFIKNINKEISAELFLAIQTFHTKKDALDFCDTWSLPKFQIIKLQSRFNFGWAIGLGRNYFAPEYAAGYLGARALGCSIVSIEDKRKWG